MILAHPDCEIDQEMVKVLATLPSYLRAGHTSMPCVSKHTPFNQLSPLMHLSGPCTAHHETTA